MILALYFIHVWTGVIPGLYCDVVVWCRFRREIGRLVEVIAAGHERKNLTATKILKWRKRRSQRKSKAHENQGNVTKGELDDGKFVQSVTNWWICTHCICTSLSPELEKTCKLGICKSSKKSGPRDESYLPHYSNIRFVTCEATTSLKQTRWNWFGKVSDMASWPRNFVWEMIISWMTGLTGWWKKKRVCRKGRRRIKKEEN